MTTAPRILPDDLTLAVDMYADDEHRSARKYDNKEPLDESGIYSLHLLAARIYAAGWEAGERVQATRERARAAREADAGRPS